MTHPPASNSFDNVDKCVDAVLAKVGKRIVLGMPLGLGKPTHFANALYQRARREPDIELTILTALSLEKPLGKSRLERNFLEPFVARQFEGVPDLDYVVDLRKSAMPANVEVREFYFKAGSYLNVPYAQKHYISSNYTHAARDLVALGVNVVGQMVATEDVDGAQSLSLSSNPDLTLDMVQLLREQESEGANVAIVGEVNRKLPFMGNHAEVPPSYFDFVIDSPQYDHELFAAPNVPITPTDHMIGFYASTLLADKGTLQVGIGSLGSALIYSTQLRHEHNDQYRALAERLSLSEKFPVETEVGGLGPFAEGLYGCSEMMVDGFLHLFKSGILSREVYSDVQLQELVNAGKLSKAVSLDTLRTLVEAGVIKSSLRARDVERLQSWGILQNKLSFRGGSLVKGEDACEANLSREECLAWIGEHGLGEQLQGGVVMHGGFYLGPNSMYETLRNLTYKERSLFCMTSVNFINHLYNHRYGDQRLKEAQRQQARFINSAMMVTLGGAAVSDGLANGQVVSGVGGQYNFVAMAHELPGARSILKLKSTRMSKGKLRSNIVFSYGHTTIPRHLRDVFVTEYGIADTRGLSDEEVAIALIKIADSRFQESLMTQAKAAGKLSQDYELPEAYRNNTPEFIAQALAPAQADGFFEAFPFGCELQAEELQLGKALKRLKAVTSTKKGAITAIVSALGAGSDNAELQPLLARMNMENPQTLKEKLEQRLLVGALLGKV